MIYRTKGSIEALWFFENLQTGDKTILIPAPIQIWKWLMHTTKTRYSCRTCLTWTKQTWVLLGNCKHYLRTKLIALMLYSTAEVPKIISVAQQTSWDQANNFAYEIFKILVSSCGYVIFHGPMPNFVFLCCWAPDTLLLSLV